MNDKNEMIDESLLRKNTPENFAIYNAFFNENDIKDFIKILDEINTEYTVEKPELIVDKVIVGNPLMPYGLVRIHISDFAHVNYHLVEHFYKMDDAELNAHFMNQFTDNELKKIIVEDNEEWDKMNKAASKAILIRRGKLSFENINDIEKQSLSNEYKGKSGNRIYMVIYGLCFLIPHPIGSIAALGMTYYYAFGKRTASDGARIYVYDHETRSLGRIIFYTGIMILLLIIVYVLYKNRE